jgi:hypothetical protein
LWEGDMPKRVALGLAPPPETSATRCDDLIRRP